MAAMGKRSGSDLSLRSQFEVFEFASRRPLKQFMSTYAAVAIPTPCLALFIVLGKKKEETPTQHCLGQPQRQCHHLHHHRVHCRPQQTLVHLTKGSLFAEWQSYQSVRFHLFPQPKQTSHIHGHLKHPASKQTQRQRHITQCQDKQSIPNSDQRNMVRRPQPQPNRHRQQGGSSSSSVCKLHQPCLQ